MAIGNVELMHECFSKHWSIGTARMNCDEVMMKWANRNELICNDAKSARNKEVTKAKL